MGPKTYAECYRRGDCGGIAQHLEECASFMLLIGVFVFPEYAPALMVTFIVMTLAFLPVANANMRRWAAEEKEEAGKTGA